MLTLVLKHGELCVCDFVKVLEITQSKASRHLRYLLNAGFLQDRREGVWSYYRINKNLNAEHTALLDLVGDMVDEKQSRELDRKLSDWLEMKSSEDVRVSCGEKY